MDANEVFREAYDRFLTSLSGQDRTLFSSCSSPDLLLSDIAQLDVICKQKRRGEKFIGRIKSLCNRLKPYFEVIGIVVSSHPEWVAVGWGVFRLALTVIRLSSRITLATLS